MDLQLRPAARAKPPPAGAGPRGRVVRSYRVSPAVTIANPSPKGTNGDAGPGGRLPSFAPPRDRANRPGTGPGTGLQCARRLEDGQAAPAAAGQPSPHVA